MQNNYIMKLDCEWWIISQLSSSLDSSSSFLVLWRTTTISIVNTNLESIFKFKNVYPDICDQSIIFNARSWTTEWTTHALTSFANIGHLWRVVRQVGRPCVEPPRDRLPGADPGARCSHWRRASGGWGARCI